MTRVVFLGTPEFAVPSLRSLIDSGAFQVVGVVSQPDRPAGRGQQVSKSSVKQEAEKHGLPLFQPQTLRNPEAVEVLHGWQPDVIVVVAFGQILRQPVLELPPLGCVNVHASLLPRWRGAAPIQYAIRAGDTRSGITIMKMDAGLDTGPILAQQSIEIAPDETGATLHDKLAALGARMLPDVLAAYSRGKIQPQPQPVEGITLAPTLKKEEGEIDWSRPAVEIDRQVRAFTPWPGTFTFLSGELLKIHRGHPVETAPSKDIVGTLVVEGANIFVQTGQGRYQIDEVQPAGKQRMSARSFLAGRPGIAGQILGRR